MASKTDRETRGNGDYCLPSIKWPEQKQFAFTIFDDTDHETEDNARPIYQLLRDLGLRTTKSVWPLSQRRPSMIGGETCGNPQYLNFCLELQREGFEIGLHNVTSHTSSREETRAGLEAFRGMFGAYPTTMANHAGCGESIYWGDERVSGVPRQLYRALNLYRYDGRFKGHIEESSEFWGDICLERIKYVRNFVFCDINTLKLCPEMPYYDPSRPFVRYWYASSDACNPRFFVHLLAEGNQDQLEQEGGACILYTHFFDFQKNGKVLPQVEQLLKRLARKNGWFVPVGTLLDYLLAQKSDPVLKDSQRKRLEWLWLRDVCRAHIGHTITGLKSRFAS
jgi:hypothetical protein